MPTSWIKYIAIAAMLCDHIGLFLFPDITFLRDIGRIAFPLFAWLIANGAYHTKDIRKYLSRLLLFAFISQIPFTLANQEIGSPLFYLNIFFTLFLGLLAIFGIKNNKNIITQAGIVIVCALAANIIHADYGAGGVLSIVMFYIFFKNKGLLLLSQLFVFVIAPYIMELVRYAYTDYNILLHYMSVEWYALLALPFIFLYNNKKGKDYKYLLYVVYPLQYLIIFAILTTGLITR